MGRRRALLGWRHWALTAAGLVVVPGWGHAQQPLPPSGPAPSGWNCEECGGRKGLLHRFGRHTSRVLKDNLIGYPEYFVVPPLGASGYEMIGMMKARADGHEFTLYRSDFQAGTTNLSPGGAQRLSRMATRMSHWLGPLVVEWTPDQPGLAEQRRAQVASLMASAGLGVGPERIVVGPSPYNGLDGNEARSLYGTELSRYQLAPQNYSLPPIQTSTFGYGGMIQ